MEAACEPPCAWDRRQGQKWDNTLIVDEWPYFPSECVRSAGNETRAAQGGVGRGSEMVGWAARGYHFHLASLDGLGHVAERIASEYADAMRKAMGGNASDRVTKAGAHLFPEDVTENSVHLRDVQGLADGFAPSLYCHTQASMHAAMTKMPELQAILQKKPTNRQKQDTIIDFYVARFPNGTALFKDHFECFLVPNLDQWFGFDRLPPRL